MASVNILLDTRRPMKTGEYPVRLQLYVNGRQYLIATPISASLPVIKRYKKGLMNSTETKQLRDAIQKELSKATDIISNLRIVTPESFKKIYYSETGIVRKGISTNIKPLYDEKISEVTEQERFGTRHNYQSSYASLNAFAVECLHRRPHSIVLQDITPDWVRKYEQWNLKRNASISTVRCYLRPLRAIMNSAISDKLISQNVYPFGKAKGSYILGKSVAAKNNLTKEQLLQLWEYDGRTAVRERDFWWFSYFCNGANPTDLLHLKMDNVHGNFIRFQRRKTQFSNESVGDIVVSLNDEMRAIIDKYHREGNDYLFDILNDGMTPEEQYKTVIDWKRLTNRMLNKVGKELGFRELSLSMARHSFATTLKLAGTSTSFISNFLGHADERTTQIYLASLPTGEVEEVAKHLHTFKKDSMKEQQKMMADRRKMLDEIMPNRKKLKAV